jgi:hypothetical protein
MARWLGVAATLTALGLGAACAQGGGETLGAGGEGGSDACAASLCEGSCVDDLDADPDNCGACGRTCVIPRAGAACISGECALSSCDTGWADCDGDLANGCEVDNACQEGSACPTSCGSSGTTSCADVCAPTCELPVEACNALDDDCDGACDNGAIAGCRVGVHRAYGANGHYYTTDPNDATSQGYNVEVLDYFHLYTTAVADLRPLFRCSKANGKPFLTTATDCEMMGGPLATVGFIAPTQSCGSVPLYRLLNTAAGAHFYTLSATERDNAVINLGFADQGIAGYAWQAP